MGHTHQVRPFDVLAGFCNMSSNQAGVYRGGNTTGTTGTTGTSSSTTGELRNTSGTAGTGVVSAQRGEPVCDQKYYTKVRMAERPTIVSAHAASAYFICSRLLMLFTL